VPLLDTLTKVHRVRAVTPLPYDRVRVDRLQDGLDALNAAISEINDDLENFADEVKAIEKEIGDVDRSVALATEQRKKEHAEYADTLQMTDVAIELIGKAKNRLQKFYNPVLYKAPPKSEKTMRAPPTTWRMNTRRRLSICAMLKWHESAQPTNGNATKATPRRKSTMFNA